MQAHLQWKKQIQKIRQPTAYCQACLGEKVEHNDFMLICSICQGSIHKSHYASQIIGKTTNQNHLIPNIEEWKCQRCRYLLEKKFQVQIKCQFCPSPRGIMKKVIFQPVLNNRKQIWVHPQCTTWCHPMIYMKSKKRTHYFKQIPNGPTAKFWFRVEDQPSKKCTLCNDNYGYKIKCSFYSCQKFYHITCAKRIGVVRDLESMRFQVSSDDFCPVYCQQHLESYVIDFANRIKLYTQKKQSQKVVHFTKVHNCYKIQLKNLTNAAKRSKQQQQIRNQLGKQLLIQSYQQSSMSLSVSQAKSNEMSSSQQDSNSSTFLAFLENNYNLNDLDRLVEKKNTERGGQKKIMMKKQSPAKKMQKIKNEQIVVESIKFQVIKSKIKQQKQYEMDQQNNTISLVKYQLKEQIHYENVGQNKVQHNNHQNFNQQQQKMIQQSAENDLQQQQQHDNDKKMIDEKDDDYSCWQIHQQQKLQYKKQFYIQQQQQQQKKQEKQLQQGQLNINDLSITKNKLYQNNEIDIENSNPQVLQQRNNQQKIIHQKNQLYHQRNYQNINTKKVNNQNNHLKNQQQQQQQQQHNDQLQFQQW